MAYRPPHCSHTFGYFTRHDLEDLAPNELEHWALIDQVMLSPHHKETADVSMLERMSDDQLRALLVDDVKPVKVKPSNPFPARASEPAPVIPQVRERVLPEWRRALLRYKAQLWHDGKPVHLGYFMSEQVRDEAIAAAKLRRSMGLPIRLTK